MTNELFDRYWKLKLATAQAWKDQQALVDRVYPPYRTEGATEAEAEAINQATEKAVALEKARGQAYDAWQRSLCQHEWVTYTSGSQYFSGGEVVENYTDHLVCTRCGKEQNDDE